jgi:hypothetical protein
MSFFTTGRDLKQDALFLAGEPQDGTSPYDAHVYEWLTVVQRALVSGGSFGPSVLQPMDWPWARAWPRGTLQLLQPFNATFTIGAVCTTGSPRVLIDSAALPDLRGWRFLRDDVAARHLIMELQVGEGAFGTTLMLQDPWSGPTNLTGDPVTRWLAYPDTYELPEDFVRGTSPLFVSAGPSWGWPAVIDVVDPADLEPRASLAWPLSNGAGGPTGGLPIVAARVTERRLRFSHYLNTPQQPLPIQVEFEYIGRPDLIQEGTLPMVPIQHRRILSYGAAYLILNDKDDATAPQLWQTFQAQWKAMADEYRRNLRRMSTRYGTVQPSLVMTGWRGPWGWTTPSSLPLW